MPRKGLPRIAVRRHNKKRAPSSIEKLVAAWLEIDGIPFKKEVKAGKCHIDIVIRSLTGQKIAIELNGCYWHGCVKCYPYMKHDMQMKRFRDIRRYQFLRRKNYKVVVLWECDILGQPDLIRSQVRQLAGKING